FKSLKTIKIPTLLGKLTFYIITSNILFLFYLKDIDYYKIYFNNLKNILI
ncbi:hypothetical protein LX36DRAFT_568367, partial [Colletotrichum falcatum]